MVESFDIAIVHLFTANLRPYTDPAAMRVKRGARRHPGLWKPHVKKTVKVAVGPLPVLTPR